MKKLGLFLSCLLSASLFLTGCGEKGTENAVAEDQLTIYTTVYPLQFFAEEIGGDAVKVETIYPPGADEHTFEPSQKDMMKLADSDLFIYVGLGLEGFVEKATESLKNEKVTFLAAGEHIQFEEISSDAGTKQTEHDDHTGDTDDHAHGDIDPHVWLDPVYSAQMAEMIKDELIKKMPEKEDQFIKNYNTLALKLSQINDKFTDIGSEAQDKEILVSHSAFGYWEKRYGLKQISISGLSTSSEPSQKELEKIVEIAKEHHIKYIFFEQNVSSKLTETVQKEIGAEALILHNLSTRTDKDIKNNDDYYTLMQHNIDVLKKALLK